MLAAGAWRRVQTNCTWWTSNARLRKRCDETVSCGAVSPGKERIVSATANQGTPARTDAATIELTLPEGPLDRNDAVIVLDLDGSAESIAPMDIKP